MLVCLRPEHFKIFKQNRVDYSRNNAQSKFRKSLNQTAIFALSVTISIFLFHSINQYFNAEDGYIEVCEIVDTGIKQSRFSSSRYLDLESKLGRVRYQLKPNDYKIYPSGNRVTVSFQKGILGFTRIVSIRN